LERLNHGIFQVKNINNMPLCCTFWSKNLKYLIFPTKLIFIPESGPNPESGILFFYQGSLLATVVLFIHARRKMYMRPLALPIRRVLQKRVVWTLLLEPPASLVELWTEYGELPESRTDSANLLLDPRLLLRLPTDPPSNFLTKFSSQVCVNEMIYLVL
jgi:hypothetical protein